MGLYDILGLLGLEYIDCVLTSLYLEADEVEMK